MQIILDIHFYLLAIVDTTQKRAGVLNELKALLQTSLWMVIMSESMGHALVPFYRDFIASLAQQLTIIFALVSFKIEFGRNDVCWSKILE